MLGGGRSRKNELTMDTIHKVKIEDKTRIKDIKLKFPELMGEDSLDKIKEEYYSLLEAKGELQEARKVVRELEKKLLKKEREWNKKKDLFEIEFESTEKEVKTTKSYMVINGATVYDCNGRR